MKVPKKKWFISVLAVLLLCTMAIKTCVILITHVSKNNELFSIEKNAEESKDAKQDPTGKGEKKIFFAGDIVIDHTHFCYISHAKPVCFYKLSKLDHPPKTVPTPPPDIQA